MENVFLRGRNDGYEIEIPADRNFADSLTDLQTLLKKVRTEDASSDEIGFKVRTGRRILTADQRKKLYDLAADFSNFKILEITADVMDQQTVATLLRSKQVHLVPNTIRSGQEASYDGDVVLLGSVHQGATLKASRNIYVVGPAQGILHAGYPDNADAIIAGNLQEAAQLRIADLVEIVADDATITRAQFAYIDDLHKLMTAKLTELQKVKPKLYQQLEEQ
ncbi:septum site-determining protein MinC [Lapidilactobacillus wuchangensis]|uniref:septum site-determining protein MinC n=1 Tax=Lapidilactobacillus wuchangensis TaxID=2486001 RepID=UPI000F7A82BE|nr:septum site-determining protein MinC [Lapidilactobacillus wuchangensis]